MKYTTLEFISAQEAIFDTETHRAQVVLVRPGMSKNRKNWSPSALKKAVESGIFNGARMYDEHTTGKKNRPLRELVSVVETTRLGDDNRIIGDIKFVDLDFEARAQRAPEHFGTSIDVLFRGDQKRDGGGPFWDVDEIVHANSVDWTGNPAAGGGIERFLTAQESEDPVEIDWTKVTLKDLQANRPDLLAARESESGSDTPPSGLTEDRVAALIADAIKKDRDAQESERAQEAEAFGKYEAVVKASPLPTKVKDRLISSFRGSKSFDENTVKAAIQQAQEEAAEYGWKGPKVTGLGPSGDGRGERQPQKLEDIREAMESDAPAHIALLRAASQKSVNRAQEGKQN